MLWIADHFFVEAKREAWFDAILISVRHHPRAIRTMEYWDHCDQRWASALPTPIHHLKTGAGGLMRTLILAQTECWSESMEDYRPTTMAPRQSLM